MQWCRTIDIVLQTFLVCKFLKINTIDWEQVKMFSKMFNAKSNDTKVDDNIAAKGRVHTLIQFIYTISGIRIRFWPKTGSGALYLNLREIFKSLMNKYVR